MKDKLKFTHNLPEQFSKSASPDINRNFFMSNLKGTMG
jgi:hypothetical protein